METNIYITEKTRHIFRPLSYKLRLEKNTIQLVQNEITSSKAKCIVISLGLYQLERSLYKLFPKSDTQTFFGLFTSECR